jgi:DNA-binding Lrp family transcriptional regulator
MRRHVIAEDTNQIYQSEVRSRTEKMTHNGIWKYVTHLLLKIVTSTHQSNRVVAVRVSKHELTPAEKVVIALLQKKKVVMHGYLRKTSHSIHSCQNTSRYCLVIFIISQKPKA